jgi:hypothetical protein
MRGDYSKGEGPSIQALGAGFPRLSATGKRNTPATNRKSFIMSCSPEKLDLSAHSKPSAFAAKGPWRGLPKLGRSEHTAAPFPPELDGANDVPAYWPSNMVISMFQLFVARTPFEGWGEHAYDGTSQRQLLAVLIVSVGALAPTLCVALLMLFADEAS